MKNKITLLTAAVVLTILVGLTSRASAQTYDRQHASTIVFAGSGTDPVNTLSFVAPPLTGTPSITLPGQSLVFPATNVLGMLWNDASGNLSWLTTLTGLTINNSTIGGTSSINTSGAITTTGVVTESNASNTFGGTFTGIFNGTVGAGTPSTGVFTTLTSNTGFTTSGGTANINNSGTQNTNINAGGTGGTIDIGNGTSTTNIAGNVDFTGSVTLPAGAVSSSSLGLAKNDIFIGDATSATADTAMMTQDVTLQNTSTHVAQATVNGSHAATFAVSNAMTVGGDATFNGAGTGLTVTNASTLTGAVTATNASNNLAGAFNGTVGAGTPSTGAFTTLSSTGNTNIDNTGTGQTINIGNSGSTTTISGAVTYTSTPTIPLTTNDLFVGVTGDAAPLASAINSVLVTNGTSNGVPSWQTTLPSGLTIPSPTISNPSISNPSFSGTVTFSTPPTLPLTLNNIYVGNSSNNAAPVVPTSNAVLITAGTGNVVPQWATTLPSGLTIPSPIINSPTINNPSFTGSLTLVAGSVTNADLANSTIAIGSTGSTLTVTGSPISLGGAAGNVELNLAHANTWTATIGNQENGIGTTQTNAYTASNTTASTSLLTVQQSPAYEMGAHVWGNGHDSIMAWRIDNIPTSATVPTSVIEFDEGNNGAGFSKEFTMSNGGVFSAATGYQINSAIATGGHYLRGNGTNYVDGTIQTNDLPSSLPSGETIPSPTISSPSISNPTFTGTVTFPAGDISYASLPSEAANTLLGNPTGSAANTTTITLGTGLAFSSGALTIASPLPSGLTIPSPTISSPSISNPSFSGTLTFAAGSIPVADLSANTTAIGSTGSTLTFTGGNGSGAIALGGTAGNFEINLTHANTWSGTQTFGGAALTSSSPTALANGSSTIDWALGTNSYFKVSALGAATVNGIAGGVDGRVLILVNTGTNNITFNTDATAETTAANRIHLAGGTSGNGFSLILAPDGFVTFIYDSSYNSVGAWRVQSSK